MNPTQYFIFRKNNKNQFKYYVYIHSHLVTEHALIKYLMSLDLTHQTQATTRSVSIRDQN
jgi:hypothetical protein